MWAVIAPTQQWFITLTHIVCHYANHSSLYNTVTTIARLFPSKTKDVQFHLNFFSTPIVFTLFLSLTHTHIYISIQSVKIKIDVEFSLENIANVSINTGVQIVIKHRWLSTLYYSFTRCISVLIIAFFFVFSMRNTFNEKIEEKKYAISNFLNVSNCQ